MHGRLPDLPLQHDGLAEGSTTCCALSSSTVPVLPALPPQYNDLAEGRWTPGSLLGKQHQEAQLGGCPLLPGGLRMRSLLVLVVLLLSVAMLRPRAGWGPRSRLGAGVCTARCALSMTLTPPLPAAAAAAREGLQGAEGRVLRAEQQERELAVLLQLTNRRLEEWGAKVSRSSSSRAAAAAAAAAAEAAVVL